MCTVPVVSITVRGLYLFPGTDGTALGTATILIYQSIFQLYKSIDGTDYQYRAYCTDDQQYRLDYAWQSYYTDYSRQLPSIYWSIVETVTALTSNTDVADYQSVTLQTATVLINRQLLYTRLIVVQMWTAL